MSDHAVDPTQYDRIVVFFSGGKDSVACVLHLLECGIDPERIELHHHLVDGREGSTLMDWPVTDAYCQAFADAFQLKLYFSWKEGGFEREMNRQDAKTAPIHWMTPEGESPSQSASCVPSGIWPNELHDLHFRKRPPVGNHSGNRTGTF